MSGKNKVGVKEIGKGLGVNMQVESWFAASERAVPTNTLLQSTLVGFACSTCSQDRNTEGELIRF